MDVGLVFVINGGVYSLEILFIRFFIVGVLEEFRNGELKSLRFEILI